MGTQAALVMVAVTLALLLPLIMVKRAVARQEFEAHGEVAAERKEEKARLVVLGVTAAAMFGLVFAYGSVVIAAQLAS